MPLRSALADQRLTCLHQTIIELLRIKNKLQRAMALNGLGVTFYLHMRNGHFRSRCLYLTDI